MPSTRWSLACLACLSTHLWGNNSSPVEQFRTLFPTTLFKCYSVYHAFLIVDRPWWSRDDVTVSQRLPLSCQSVYGETEDLAAKTGQSNLYFVQQIVANLESIFLLDVV